MVVYGFNLVFWNVDVKIFNVGIMGIIGFNGVGKSIFLKVILGMVLKLFGIVKFYSVGKKGLILIGYVF